MIKLPAFLRRAAPTERRYIAGTLPTSGDWGTWHRSWGGAEGLSVVVACVSIISQSVASLPVRVYRRTEAGGREVVRDHPVADLIRRGPNSTQSFADLLEMVVAETLLLGNSVVAIEADQAGAVTGLDPIPWRSISVDMTGSRRLLYRYNPPTLHGEFGPMEERLEDDVVHVRDGGSNRFLGVPRLLRAGSAGDNAMMLDTHVKSVWRNHGVPSSILEADSTLKPDAIDFLTTSLEKFRSEEHRGRAMVLEGGMKYRAVEQLSPEAAEILESRRFAVEELSRIFQVPLPLLNDLSRGTYNNSSVLIQSFAKQCLTYWCTKLEKTFSRALFPEGDLELDIDLSGLLRGDPTERWASHEVAARIGAMTVNEIREAEGLPPIEGGDVPAQAAPAQAAPAQAAPAQAAPAQAAPASEAAPRVQAL